MSTFTASAAKDQACCHVSNQNVKYIRKLGFRCT